MFSMKPRSWMISVAAAVLAACGGGGGGDEGAPVPTAAAIDKYVGTWSTCMQESGASARATLTVNKTGATSANYTFRVTGHANTSCSGAAVATETESGTATLVGTKTVSGATADKVNLVADGTPEKDVFAIVDGKLRTGLEPDDGGSSDAEGYPNAFNNDLILSKQ